MSPKPWSQSSDNNPKDAIDAVLEAERRTMDAIAECDRRASAIIETARETARQIARRTDQRIAAVHGKGEPGERPTLAAPPQSVPEARLTDAETAALRAAADRVAELLTTTSNDEPTA